MRKEDANNGQIFYICQIFAGISDFTGMVFGRTERQDVRHGRLSFCSGKSKKLVRILRFMLNGQNSALFKKQIKSLNW